MFHLVHLSNYCELRTFPFKVFILCNYLSNVSDSFQMAKKETFLEISSLTPSALNFQAVEKWFSLQSSGILFKKKEYSKLVRILKTIQSICPLGRIKLKLLPHVVKELSRPLATEVSKKLYSTGLFAIFDLNQVFDNNYVIFYIFTSCYYHMIEHNMYCLDFSHELSK